MTKVQLAYLAGIIDGEGCVNIYRARSTYNGRLYVVNTSWTLIQWLLDNFGGLHYTRETREGWKTKYEWIVERRALDGLIPAILPYSVIKQRQLLLLQDFRKTFEVRHPRIPPDILATRERSYLKMRELNSL